MASIQRDKKGHVTVTATMWEWEKILDRIENADVERHIESHSFAIAINADEGALDLAEAATYAERDGAIRMDVKDWT